MRLSKKLPRPPHFDIEVIEDQSSRPGFLKRVSRRMRLIRPAATGTAATGPKAVGATAIGTKEFVYDEVDRSALDAVVVVPHFVDEGERYVVLRSAVRPPVVLRQDERSPFPEPPNRALWEVPAGLVEANEVSPQGIRQAALREMLEEVGFSAIEEQLFTLGPATFPCPGVVAERQYFFHVMVRPDEQKTPSLDGSPLEEAGEVIAVLLSEALSQARAGGLADAKTELALRRLDELLLQTGDIR